MMGYLQQNKWWEEFLINIDKIDIKSQLKQKHIKCNKSHKKTSKERYKIECANLHKLMIPHAPSPNYFETFLEWWPEVVKGSMPYYSYSASTLDIVVLFLRPSLQIKEEKKNHY